MYHYVFVMIQLLLYLFYTRGTMPQTVTCQFSHCTMFTVNCIELSISIGIFSVLFIC